MNLNRLRDNPVLLLMLGSTIVAASRYVTVFAFTEQFRITGLAWAWFNALSGLGMVILEGFAVFFCWNAWSKAPASTERNVLLALIIAMFATLTGAVMPALQATTLGATLPQVMPGPWLWLWSGCVTVAPFLVMGASGLADKLRNSRKPQAESRQVAITPAIQVAPPVNQVAAITQPALPPADKVLTLQDVMRDNPDGSITEWAQALKISRQAVAQRLKRLEASGQLRRNGHVTLIDEQVSGA